MYITMKPYIIKYDAFAILLKDGKYSLDIQFLLCEKLQTEKMLREDVRFSSYDPEHDHHWGPRGYRFS